MRPAVSVVDDPSEPIASLGVGLIDGGAVSPGPGGCLAVVARGRQDIYDHLLVHAGTPRWVTVIWDRREEGRRRHSGSVTTERRHAERRRRPPDTWTTLGFLLVSPPALRP